MTVPAPFDRVAAIYDALWTGSDAGRAQREIVWRVVDSLFKPGDEILDIGCGTGEDAVHLGRRGVRVSAIDASSQMVRMAASRGVATTQLAAEELHRIHAQYDGALSDFGPLNCIADLRGAAESMAQLVRPQGHVVVCLLNRTCIWEMVWFGLRLQLRKAFRRLGRKAIQSSLGVAVFYPSARDVRRAFRRGFELLDSTGAGVFVPPSYVHLSARTIRRTAWLDLRVSHLPVFRTLGDHRVYVFRRRSEC
jgi:ubiquinone/menaquinone biosynthesis C-methylase UbiE